MIGGLTDVSGRRSPREPVGWAQARASFVPRPESARAGRRYVEQLLVAWGLPDLVDPTRLMVSELLTNVVYHAHTDSVMVVGVREGVLRVEVSDRDPELPRPPVDPVTAPVAPAGRGLLILDALADQWGVDPDDDGKTVWFEIAVPAPGSGVDAHQPSGLPHPQVGDS